MTVLLVPLVPLLGAVAALALRRRPAALAGAIPGAMLATAGVALLAGMDGSAISWGWGPGLRLHLAAEGYARVMAVLVPVVAAPVMLYAATAEDLPAPALSRLLVSMSGFVAAMEFLVLAGDLLTLLIGWELVGAFSWMLIGFHWRDAERPRSAAVAYLTTRFGDLGLYLAAAAALTGVGSLEYAALPGADGVLLHVIAAGVLLAAAAKSAQLPFSPWLFSAMAGPTPVSALLHSATLVAAGAYVLVRLAPALAPTGWFGPAVVAVGMATVLVGGGVALVHTDVKRTLAASTVSQYGLMFVAVGAGSVAAAGAHLVAHALFKSLLFLGAGIAIHAAGTDDLRRLGLGRRLPWVAALFGVGALSLAALPPLGAAFTKEAVVSAGLHASPWLGAILLASGFLTALYAARLWILTYGTAHSPDRGSRSAGDRSSRMPGVAERAAMATLASLALALSLLWLPAGGGLVEAVTGGQLSSAAWWELWAGGLVLATAGATAWLLWRRGALIGAGLPAPVRRGLSSWLGIPALARVGVIRPVLVLSTRLARFDDRVVDAGVRGAAALGRAVSGALSAWTESGIDGVVEGLRGWTVGLANASKTVDDRGVDGAVEGLARGASSAGAASRGLQTGMAHHYYVVAGVGLLVLLATMILAR